MDYALNVYYISLFIDMDCVVAADITFMWILVIKHLEYILHLYSPNSNQINSECYFIFICFLYLFRARIKIMYFVFMPFLSVKWILKTHEIIHPLSAAFFHHHHTLLVFHRLLIFEVYIVSSKIFCGVFVVSI